MFAHAGAWADSELPRRCRDVLVNNGEAFFGASVGGINKSAALVIANGIGAGTGGQRGHQFACGGVEHNHLHVVTSGKEAQVSKSMTCTTRPCAMKSKRAARSTVR